MANKTYYEQNYPTTKYEHSSKGYRNERLHSGDSRKIKMQYVDSSASVNPEYMYYNNFPGDEGYEKGGEHHWNNSSDCCVQKPKSIHGPSKRSAMNQPSVGTPRYYRNSVHRRPSAICIPLLAQPESNVRRKTKSQSRVDGIEREQKSVRYRGVKQPRHHLLPPPPSLPHHIVQSQEQTDFETSSGDGHHSLQSHTQSSGSLSVDISSQVETLNQSFNAVTKERKGKKIIYGDVEPVFTNIEPAHNKHYGHHIKQRKTYRRHSRRHKHVEPLENWATQLWDLPEENQDQDWLDKAETGWTSLDQHNSHSVGTNVDSSLRKSHSRKHHHSHHYRYPPEQIEQIAEQPRIVPPKLLNPSLPRPRTRGSHESSKDSQVNEVPKKPEASTSNQGEKIEKLNFLENLFSEVFAQGCVDKLSKRTRLDFIKEAYNNYSASLEDTDKINDHSKDSGVNYNPEPYLSNQMQEVTNQWCDEYVDPNLVENNQGTNFTLPFENNNSQLHNTMRSNNFAPPDNRGNSDQSMSVNEVVSNNTEINPKGVTNFFLSVKPRRRSMKLNDAESQEKDGNAGISIFPEQEKDSIPRFPNLIENMSARYIGSSNIRKARSGHHEDHSYNQNQTSHPVPSPSNFTNSFSDKEQPSKEYNFSNQMNNNNSLDAGSHLQKSNVSNEKFVYCKPEPSYNNQEAATNRRFSSNHYNENNFGHDHPNQLNSLEATHYSNTNHADYLNNSFNGQLDEKKINNNYSVNEESYKSTFDNPHNIKDEYSSNMENNYITIKKCQEILNHVKEDFGEHMKKNPDVFHSGPQHENEINSEATYCVGGSDYRENSPSFKESHVGENYPTLERECRHENTVVVSHCTNYYENIHSHGDGSQNYSDAYNSKSQESQKNLANNNSQIQDVQGSFSSRDKKKNSQNKNCYYENSASSTTRANNQLTKIEENSSNNQGVSSYEAIDQDKIKQFIHSLTGFDVIQAREASAKREVSGCLDDYQKSDPSYHFDKSNSQESYLNTVSNRYFAVNNKFQSSQNPHCQMNQSFQQQIQPPRPNIKGVELTNVEGCSHYSIPQRKEIEKMKQDTRSASVSVSKEKEQNRLAYQKFPDDFSYQVIAKPNDLTTKDTNEAQMSEFQLHKSRNNTDLIRNDNYDNSKSKELNFSRGEFVNISYPYDSNYSTLPEQVHHTRFHHNDESLYYNSSVCRTANNLVSQKISQSNENNCITRSDSNSVEDNYIDAPQHSCNHEHYCETDSNNQQCSYENCSYKTNDVQTPTYLTNNDPDFENYDETRFENEFPVEADDSKSTVVKRKYCYMPSENYEPEEEKYGEASMSDQSVYKTYIENLIDNSLQTPGNEGLPEAMSRSVKQGRMIQNQGDVVELETDKAIDLVMNESSCQMDSKLCLEITQRLTDTLVQSRKDIPTPCLVALEEPVYLQQLKKLRWDHLRHIEREVKRLESLEKFLDTCGCGHMMYTKNTV